VPGRASIEQRERHAEYLSALIRSESWAVYRESATAAANCESQAESLLSDLEKDIAERALTIGLTVGISRNRYIDLFTIFAAALELQLHVLSRLLFPILRYEYCTHSGTTLQAIFEYLSGIG
jgi:hypothetical protein